MRIKDISGQQFGRLLAEAFVGFNKHHSALWECLCDCGTKKVVEGHALRSGHARSCGCLLRDVSASINYRHGHTSGASHGGSKSPTYRTWRSMINRCYRPKEDSYQYYGLKGIRVCDRWRFSFEEFLKDMGERPQGKTIGRKDASGHYEPDNCRWEDAYQQSANRSDQTNNTSGQKGVCFIQNRWQVKITRRGETRYFGRYLHFSDAKAAAIAAYADFNP